LTRRSTLHVATAILFFAGGTSSAQEPSYGSVELVEWVFPNGVLDIRISPWEEIENVDIPDWAMERRLTAALGEKALDKQYKVKKSGIDNAWYIVRDLRRKRGSKRFSILTVCTYKGKGEHVRTIDAFGNLDILLEDNGAVKPRLMELMEERCEQHPSSARRAVILGEIRTEPGKGVQAAQIETVLGGTRQYYSGDFLALETVINVLFKDGWAYRDPTVAVSDVDVSRSRELQPDKWRKWRKRGSKYQTTDPSVSDEEWSEIDYSWQIKPVESGKRYSGYYDYSSVSGSRYHGSFISRGSYLLRSDGTYKSSSASSFGGNTATANLGSINMYSYCNEKGGSTQVSGTGPGVVMSTKRTKENCGDGKAGSYHVRDYTIELQANNGQIYRLPFYELKEHWLVIGWQGYTADKD